MELNVIGGDGEITGELMFYSKGGLLRIWVLESWRGAESNIAQRQGPGVTVAEAKLRPVRRRYAWRWQATQYLALGKQRLEYGCGVDRRGSGKALQGNNGRCRQ